MWEPGAKPKRNPYCSRCRNHGKSAQVKGHKRHCEYRYCQCEGCKLVECRQIVSAAQIKRRRYQKQDEECGRRIEISPPVLTRAPNNDPATLIAKTLIGSARHAGGSTKPLDVGVGAPPAAGQAQLQTQLQNQLQNHMMSLPAFHSSAGPSLSDALLFQFTAAFSQQHANPSNLLMASGSSSSSGGNAGGGGGGTGPGANQNNNGGPSSGPPSTLLPNSSFPGWREQFNMVEEIHQGFGPLAIFAWLRLEDFNMAKVRMLIDLAKVSYDELLQMNGHSPLDLTSPIVDI